MVREYTHLDKSQWRNLFDRYCFLLNSANGDKRDILLANIQALENTLYIMGDARTGSIEPCVATIMLVAFRRDTVLTSETMGVISSMIADLDQWNRESETYEVSSVRNVVTEPKKKSFFKRLFSK